MLGDAEYWEPVESKSCRLHKNENNILWNMGFLAEGAAASRQKRRHQDLRTTGEKGSLKWPCGMAFSEISGMAIN